MFQNYMKIAWRNLFRNKGFSATNILGLTIGLACTIFILLWVRDELSYNKFQANYADIYQVIAHRDFNNQVFTDRNMVLPFAKAIGENMPQVKNAVVTTHPQQVFLEYERTKLKKSGYTVSEHYFDMFSWQFIKGDPKTAVAEPTFIVLTQSAATAFFGDADPLDKSLTVDNDQVYKVSAVVADPPSNSTLQFDYIMPFNFADEDLQRAMNNWQNSSWELYVQPVAGADLQSVEKGINDIKYEHDEIDKKISTYFAFPMSKWRLYSDFKDGKNVGGMIEYVRLFAVIALIILLIACVNFMNLSTARSEKRAKEVGVRKTLGSDKKQLVLQFFFESMILAVISFVFAIAAVYLLMPAFNLLVDKRLTLDFSQPVFWLGGLALIAVTGIVAGSYPALYLSSFNPLKVLKGTFLTGKKAALPRRVLVVGQFVISILLISATIIVYQQIQHTRNRDMGYNPDNLIMVPATEDTQKNFEAIRQELSKTGMVEAMTRTLSPITEVWWRSPAPHWEGQPEGSQIIFTGNTSDVSFTETLGIKMIAGKDFTGAPSDSSAMLLNQAAVEAMGLKDPVGMQLRYGRPFTVIGVTENVVMDSPFQPVDPMMVFFDPGNANSISLRLKEGVKPQEALQVIEPVFKQFNPKYPFEYQFADQEFGKKFLTEELISKLTNIFAALAIFICCIGLAGLVSFTIEKRIREIGIRKVLGASVNQILMLVSKEFLKLVLIAFVLAVPLTWWLMDNWLRKYTYHTNIGIWVFTAVGAGILALTLVVVSANTLRAAMAKPVESLRSE